LPADERGNHLSGNVIARNIENCTVFSRNRVIGVIGLKGLAVIDTPDALLVVDKDSAQEVKHIVSTLKSENNPTYKTHQTTIRPWGSFTVLGEGPGFKVKSITVNPGGKLSLQSHEHRSEHWTVVTGIAKVLNGDQELTLEKDGYTFIPATYKHRLENIGLDGLTLIETQSGDYLGEDDIVRYDDIYGRA
jgi:mannose-1-phosphate guanylyltransferase